MDLDWARLVLGRLTHTSWGDWLLTHLRKVSAEMSGVTSLYFVCLSSPITNAHVHVAITQEKRQEVQLHK